MTEESYPISDTLEVIEGTTIYKTEKWWSAVLLIISFGRKQIATYLWNHTDNGWKRRQKFVVQNVDNWNTIKSAVEEYLLKL